MTKKRIDLLRYAFSNRSLSRSSPGSAVALTKHFEGLIARLVSSGRYNNASEGVRAGLRNLEAQETA